jgi:hypothetical protein
MGTQWVVRSKEAHRDELGFWGAYRPRHAKPRRHQARAGYPGDQASALVEGEPTGQLDAPGRGNDAHGPASISQVLRDQAASFVRDHTIGYSDERWSHQGSG